MTEPLNSRLRTFVERILPRFLISRLDPIQTIIATEVADLAAQVTDNQVILDAGAGEALHRRSFSRGRYLALDNGLGDSKWDYSRLDIRGDLSDLPLRDQSVDGVLCMVVLEHTQDPRHVLSEFARVLKPGGVLRLVVPFLWEEHQIPQDYFRFTRYGVKLLFENLPLSIDLLRPMGGFFGVCARRSVNFLGFFQNGWRWLIFVPLAPIFGFLLPLMLHSLDGLDRERHFSLGFVVHAVKSAEDRSVAGSETPKARVGLGLTGLDRRI
jgi:SAM-dependent methyltransferase